MVFHVAGALYALRIGLAVEFGENLRHRFTHDIGEHVQPAAMRHADDGFMNALVGGALQNFVKADNRAFQPFKAKALLPDEAALQEMFELFGLDQAIQNALPYRIVQLPEIHGCFHAVLEPLLLLRILNMHVFDADGAAICGPQPVQDLAQRLVRLHIGGDRSARSLYGARQKRAIQIPNRKAIRSRV